jgi:hypothetical protein
LEEMLRLAKAHANTLLGTLADHLAIATQSLKNETAAAAALASVRPGTDTEGRCKAFRDVFGSAYFTFKVDLSTSLSVSTDQSVSTGESNYNLGRRLREEKGAQERDIKKEGAGTKSTTKKRGGVVYPLFLTKNTSCPGGPGDVCSAGTGLQGW